MCRTCVVFQSAFSSDLCNFDNSDFTRCSVATRLVGYVAEMADHFCWQFIYNLIIELITKISIFAKVTVKNVGDGCLQTQCTKENYCMCCVHPKMHTSVVSEIFGC